MTRANVFGSKSDWDRWFGGPAVEDQEDRDDKRRRRCTVIYKKQFRCTVTATSWQDAVDRAMKRGVEWERIGTLDERDVQVFPRDDDVD